MKDRRGRVGDEQHARRLLRGNVGTARRLL
jgi:hypothetical protein